MNFNKVFISYGRKESKAFAQKLHDRLVGNGFQVWFDQNDIPLAVDFQEQIDDGISKSDNFVFIIAPHAIKSPYCLKEIELAIRLNKRIIPILHIEPSSQDIWDKMHPTISKLNWIYMREKEDPYASIEYWEQIDSFDSSFLNLINLLKKHEEYISLHTSLLFQAREWERNQRQSSFLLVGSDRLEAEEWLLKSFINEQAPCHPTLLHADYICESKKNANNLLTDVFISAPEDLVQTKNKIAEALSFFGKTSWLRGRDIKTGVEYEDAIRRGIEQADNFLLILSPDTIFSEQILSELSYAQSLNKRILPILAEQIDLDRIPKSIRGIRLIDFTDNSNQSDFEADISILIRELDTDYAYYYQHKNLLVQALKWKRQNNNDSILLRGHRLENANTWYKLGMNRSDNKPTYLHEELISESAVNAAQITSEVFISYSRKDADFARHLNEELQLHGKTTWFDQENIGSATDFEAEIKNGISDSDNFLFIISPRSIASEYCEQEVNYAHSLNKRIITVLWEEVEDGLLPSKLSQIHWIDFRPSNTDFHHSFSELIRTLDLDRSHIQSHTRWASEAREWLDSGKDDDFLLRGSEFALADIWLQETIDLKKIPPATELQKEFIDRSRVAVLEQTRSEQRINTALRARFRLSVYALIVAVLAIGFSIYKIIETNDAYEKVKEERILSEQSENEAKIQKKIAEEALAESMALKQEAEKAKKDLEDALLKAGFAKFLQNQALEEKKKIEDRQLNNTSSKINEVKVASAQEKRQIMEHLLKVKNKLIETVDGLKALGVVRPAVKQRLIEEINNDFNEVFNENFGEVMKE